MGTLYQTERIALGRCDSLLFNTKSKNISYAAQTNMHTDNKTQFPVFSAHTLRFGWVCFILVLADLPAVAVENWPHWRGPHADGSAPHAKPPTTWDGATGKNFRWHAELAFFLATLHGRNRQNCNTNATLNN